MSKAVKVTAAQVENEQVTIQNSLKEDITNNPFIIIR